MVFLEWVIGIIAFIIVLTVIVGLHEVGHLFFAKKAKILCHEYAIGMGPALYKKRTKHETVFSIRAIPLGGFVSMAGEEVEEDVLKDIKEVKLELIEGRVSKIILDLENEKYASLPTYKLVSYDLYGTKEALNDELFIEVSNDCDSVHHDVNTEKFIVNRNCLVVDKKTELQIAPYDRTFVNKSFWQKFFTILGGPLMNFILAWIIFVLIGIFGGYANFNSTKLGDVGLQSREAGLTTGDVILKIGDIELDTNEWSSISNALAKYASGEVAGFDSTIVVEYQNKNGEIKTTTVYPQILVYSLEMEVSLNADGKVIVDYISNGEEDIEAKEKTFSQTKAGKSGLKYQDIIVSVTPIDKDGEKETVAINSLNDILAFFSAYDRASIKGDDLKVTVLRSGETVEIKTTTYSQDLLKNQSLSATKVYMGVSPIYEFNFVKLLYEPFVSTGKATMLVFDTLRLLLFDKSVGIKNLSGPIGILSLIKNATKGGVLNVMNWAAIISVNIGFINLLPLPALDGGRLAFVIYEGITKKKPSPKVENLIHNIGFILLMILFVIVAFNDIIRLIQSIF